MRVNQRAACACVAALVASGPAIGDETESIGASQDNTLYESSTGSISNGAGEHFFAGRTATGPIRRGLVMFDVASVIPAGSVVSAVRLTLHVTRTLTGPESVSVHRALASWGEGTSHGAGEEGQGAPATSGDATWLHRSFPSSLWQSAGGDFAPAVSASTLVGGIGAYSWESLQLVNDVQAWVNDPATNFGWMLLGNESSTFSSKRFGSKDNINSALRPELSVTYVPSPSIATPLVLGAAIVAMRRRRSDSSH